MSDITVTTELKPREALALAQLCKRISFNECKANAIDDDEAYEMINAIAKLRYSLDNACFYVR